MKLINAYLTAFRFKNLIIIALTMFLMRWGIVEPYAKAHTFSLQTSWFQFSILVLSVILIAAGGYLINDYFDLKIDRINKPSRIVVGTVIKRRVAIVLHWAIHALGFLLGLYVAIKVGLWQLCFIHLFLIFALWFYSVEFKRQLIIGNLVISLAVAMVPLTIVLFEIPALEFYYAPKILEIAQEYEKVKQPIRVNINDAVITLSEDPRIAYAKFRSNLFLWVLGFSVFAFFLSLAREIVKDAADIEGDKAYKCRTIPIVWGLKSTKIVLSVIYAFVLLALWAIQQSILPDKYTFVYLLAFLSPMIIFSHISAIRAKTSQDFKRAGTINKITSVIGVSYAFLVFYILTSVNA